MFHSHGGRMKTFRFLLTSIILLGCTQTLTAQSSFDINTYQQFLLEHKNLTSQQLAEMYPAGKFERRADINMDSVLYLDSIRIKYGITDEEFALLQDHGFFVSERLSKNSFGEAFTDIWEKDLPVFISTDAILHAFHRSYDVILKITELDLLAPKLDSLLGMLHDEIIDLEGVYNKDSAMSQTLRDVDVYLTVPLILLGHDIQPYFPENETIVQTILDGIEGEYPVSLPLFAETNRDIDFSQFKVRGHYDDDYHPILAKYFKAMMWLGRIELYLLPPSSVFGDPIPFEDVQRQIIDAVLILEATKGANALPLFQEIEDVIRFFVGESDNLTLPQMDSLITSTGLSSASDLLDSVIAQKFMDTLKTKTFAFQNILSQILIADPMDMESITPPSAFLLFGQRFIIDSYITSQVVYDRIWFGGQNIARLLPSTLDVLFGLGNDAAIQLLQSELDKYKYASNLASLRYLINNYDEEYWNSSLFNLWLQVIRTLNPPAVRDSLPGFMQTGAWWQEKMNTQLASWSQLRHDNILYAKQSYTGGFVCSYPYGYVEPNPEFYLAVKNYGEIAKEEFSQMPFTSEYGRVRDYIVGYYSKLSGTMDTLITIAQKELEHQQLSSDEINFLQHLLYSVPNCVPTYDGWYPALYYRGENDMLEADFTVADVHTVPTDENGAPVGWILHAGTGRINMGVWIAHTADNTAIAYVGPVMSYHEYLTTNFLRLSDEDWKGSYLINSTRPAWVNLYLTDTLGNKLPAGINLITSSDDEDVVPPIPGTAYLHQNYPNPFNSSTIISYTIPANLSNSRVRLEIHNVFGQRVKTLLDETLPFGNYMTRWDGSDEAGNASASGVYFCHLKVGNIDYTKKITLLK